MRTFFILAVANLVVDAAVLVNRQAASISAVISGVGTSLINLDTAVKAFDGKDFNNLATNAFTLTDTIKRGTANIQAAQPIGLLDALGLQQSLAPIQTSANSLTKDLIAKKPQFEDAGLCDVIRSQGGEFAVTAKGLVDATVQKLPAIAKQIAGQQTGQLTSVLGGVQEAFAPGNCTNKVAGAAPSGASGNNATVVPMRKRHV